MGLFGRSRKEKEIEAAYMERINVPACMNQNFSLTIDDTFTIIGTGEGRPLSSYRMQEISLLKSPA